MACIARVVPGSAITASEGPDAMRPAAPRTTDSGGARLEQDSEQVGEAPVAAGRAGAPDAPVAHVRLFAVEERPFEVGDALSAATRLALGFDGADPLLPTSRLAPAGELARGERADELLAALDDGRHGRVELVLETRARLADVPGGVGLFVEARAIEVPAEPDNFLGEYPSLGAVPRSVGLHVARGGAPKASHSESGAQPRSAERGFELALSLEGLVRPQLRGFALEPLPGERPPGAQRPERERLLLRDPPRLGEPLAVVVDSPFEGGAAAAWVAWIELGPSSAGDDVGDQACWTVPQSPSAEPARDPSTPSSADSELDFESGSGSGSYAGADLQPGTAAELARLADAADPRAALVFVARPASDQDPSLAVDLALFAELELIREVLVAAAGAFAALPDPSTNGRQDAQGATSDPLSPPERAWIVERAAFVQLARMQLEAGLEPALEAALLRHTGEAGRYPSTVDSLARQSANRAAFERALVEENAIFLRDRNPAARVRAYDWLAERGAAPAGYDPLGIDAERNAALAAAAQTDPDDEEDADGAAQPAENAAGDDGGGR